jgi:hypothetical protein
VPWHTNTKIWKYTCPCHKYSTHTCVENYWAERSVPTETSKLLRASLQRLKETEVLLVLILLSLTMWLTHCPFKKVLEQDLKCLAQGVTGESTQAQMWKSKQRNPLTHSMLLLHNLQGECAGHDRECIFVVSLQDPVLQVYFAAQKSQWPMEHTNFFLKLLHLPQRLDWVLLQAADPEAQIKTYVNGVACMLILDFNKERFRENMAVHISFKFPL